jgi:hypothetical protein
MCIVQKKSAANSEQQIPCCESLRNDNREGAQAARRSAALQCGDVGLHGTRRKFRELADTREGSSGFLAARKRRRTGVRRYKSLLVAQREHRINAGGAQGWDKAGQQRYGQEQRDGGG